MTLVEELRTIYRLRGDTYSSLEVFGAIARAANKIESLTEKIRILEAVIQVIESRDDRTSHGIPTD